ncbi:GNAT family N-acetyltransferase [Reichenbachiella versicolor]|uniref:GNAT family N-acetyltransferase n=1 Tax=Reichenbachiella versicolor TaxID=1821036 RepID=UPI000D6DF3A4|nr:GNAT family N-acetyltransferase [Reichenbachiella versicolor]
MMKLKTKASFSQHIERLGSIDLIPFDLNIHAEKVHSWVIQPYAVYWGMMDNTLEQFIDNYKELLAPDYYEAYVGVLDGEVIFLAEIYDPKFDQISEYIEIKGGDVGMHLLVAPPKKRITNFTWHVFSTVMNFLFTNSDCHRVVVEPDVRNGKIHILNKKAGFKYQKLISLPHKNAWLATCTKQDFMTAKNKNSPTETVPFIDPQIWKEVNSRLIAKAISEFSHELILKPDHIEHDLYKIETSDKETSYLFEAKLLPLDHWVVDIESVEKIRNGKICQQNLVDFVLEFRDQLKIPDEFLATYLEEISSTINSLAYKFKNQKFTSAELVHLDFQTIEHAMTEGHPCFIANSGRIGFNQQDFEKYAPEADQHLELIWLAGHKSFTAFTCTSELSYPSVLEQELGNEVILEFNNTIKSNGASPSDYFFIPVHPWQWENKISLIFINDLASKNLIYLGQGKNKYSPQQSIRTLFNSSKPTSYYVKTALSILNMGFVRGLSVEYMKSTPPITQWIENILSSDSVLKDLGFEMLGEVATVGFKNQAYASLGYRHTNNKMLAALWRESPISKLHSDEQCMTMAALLHVDRDGEALIKHLIVQSELSTEQWVDRYLKAYLLPLIHCLYQHRLVFMPHGENIILKMKNHIPVGIFMKDITEEVLVFDSHDPLPEHANRLLTETPLEMQALCIQTDVFDSFFRFLSAILQEQIGYSSSLFWNQVSECILRYQKEHPELVAIFEKIDLLGKDFKRCCLNRLQLYNTKQMLNLSDPINTLKIEGVLQNPISITETQLN